MVYTLFTFARSAVLDPFLRIASAMEASNMVGSSTFQWSFDVRYELVMVRITSRIWVSASGFAAAKVVDAVMVLNKSEVHPPNMPACR